MTDGGIKAMVEALRRRLVSVDGAVALIGVLALIIGFFIGSLVGRILTGLVVAASGAYLFASWYALRRTGPRDNEENTEEMSQQLPEGNMKKLLFDDFQSSGGKYVVKEVEEEKTVVPSTKSARPAAMGLKPEVVRELEILDFFDLDSDASYSETEPKSEFHSLLNKVLLVLKDVLFAHTVAFFWANREKQQMVLESMATDGKSFMNEKRFPVGQDLVSQVALNGKPQVLGRLNPATEKEILYYYETPADVKSALCVPVYFSANAKDMLPVAVIVADSKAEDAFGGETLSILGRFTKLVSALIKSYTDKYDLLLDSELLTSIRRMQDRVKSDPGEQTILASLAEEANRLLNWDFMTVVMYADERHGWTLQKVVNKAGRPYVAPDQMIDIQGSVVGEVISTNSVKGVDDLSTAGVVRFHSAENIESSGSFLCVPISSFNRCYGAATLESCSKSNFSGHEVETIYRLVENAASALEVLYMNDLVKDHVVVDHLTGTLTKKHFLKTLEEEVKRAEDFGTELTCVSIGIDALQEHIGRYGRDGADTILNEVSKVLRSNIRHYDVLGRQDEDRLGVLLINTAASDAYLWAEKLRKMISSHVITVGTKTLSVTVSAGVCGLTEGMQTGELVAGTAQVLGKAMEHGGNLVRVY